MAEYETVIRGGTVVTALEQFRADIGIDQGRIAAIGASLNGAATIEADGLLVMPGGVDTHCHLEQLRPDGSTDEDSFITGGTSALAGGTTTAITFSAQFKGRPILPSLTEYRRRAASSLIDYGLHQIISDATDTVIAEEIPALVREGIRSLKVFLTYDPWHLDDRGLLRVLAAARREGALVTIHCENYQAIAWRTEALLAAGHTAPKYHAWARPAVIEREAVSRAIALAELVDQPVQIFHVSCAEVAEEIARAQARGLKIWSETCPHYLTITETDMDRPGFEGAKFMFAPAARPRGEAEGLWTHIRRGTIDTVSSDHSGFNYEGSTGKRLAGQNPAFPDILSGVAGVGARMAVLFSEGVTAGRISACDFVRLTAFHPARLFGLPQKGRISPGADADLVLWDPAKQVTLTNALTQHAIDYTPYEGMRVTGWPVATLLRGRAVMRDGKVTAEPGSGRYLPRGRYDFIKPLGRLPNGFDASAFA
jgi:dihydropyrimidinase